jgi:hypothetical protein
VEDSQHMNVVFQFLTEGVRQPGKSAHTHPHVEVLAFDITGRNVILIHCCPKQDRVEPGMLKAKALRSRKRGFQIEVSYFHWRQPVQVTSTRA